MAAKEMQLVAIVFLPRAIDSVDDTYAMYFCNLRN